MNSHPLVERILPSFVKRKGFSKQSVATEIRSIFKGPMNNDPNFPFLYLQPTGCGSKSLTIPSQSSTFRWTPQQVARLSGQAGSIYIQAQSELKISNEPTEVMMQKYMSKSG